MVDQKFCIFCKLLICIGLTDCFFFVQFDQSLVFRAFGKTQAEISTKLSTKKLS